MYWHFWPLHFLRPRKQKPVSTLLKPFRLAVPAVGIVALIYWRFICELFMIAFMAYDRLGEIRNLLAGAPANQPDPDHPEF